jgi:hypothetical protein
MEGSGKAEVVKRSVLKSENTTPPPVINNTTPPVITGKDDPNYANIRAGEKYMYQGIIYVKKGN